MRGNLHWSVQLAMLVGLIGLFVVSRSLWLGILMILVGVGVPIMALWQARQGTPSAPRPRISRQRQPAPPAPRPAVQREYQPARPASTPHHPVDRNKLGILRYTLHQANLDSNAPVYETGEQQAVTVRDILVEMIDIAEAQGRPVEVLARDIVAMYPRIFEHVKAALHQYRDDEELAKTYIARKAMTDIGWELDQDYSGN